MPRGNGTGPNSLGPMTGRGAGYCNGYNTPGYANPGFGSRPGSGFGRGMGRGLRGGNFPFFGGRGAGGFVNTMPAYGPPANYAAPTREQEIELLRKQAADYEQGLQEIKDRIDELEK